MFCSPFFLIFLADKISVAGLETVLNYCYLEHLHLSSEDVAAEALCCFKYFQMSEEVEFLAGIMITNMSVENSFKWYSVFKDLELIEFEGKADQFLKVFFFVIMTYFWCSGKISRNFWEVKSSRNEMNLESNENAFFLNCLKLSGKFFALSANRRVSKAWAQSCGKNLGLDWCWCERHGGVILCRNSMDRMEWGKSSQIHTQVWILLFIPKCLHPCFLWIPSKSNYTKKIKPKIYIKKIKNKKAIPF